MELEHPCKLNTTCIMVIGNVTTCVMVIDGVKLHEISKNHSPCSVLGDRERPLCDLSAGLVAGCMETIIFKL